MLLLFQPAAAHMHITGWYPYGHLEGLGRLRSIQGLPSIMPHGMIDTPHGVDFSFSFYGHLAMIKAAAVAGCHSLLSHVCSHIMMPNIEVCSNTGNAA